MENFLSIAGALPATLQVLTIVLLCIVFWEPIAERVFGYKRPESEEGEAVRERASKDWFNDISTIVKDQSDQIKLLGRLMGDLAQHYNHETTEILTQINAGIGKLISKHEEWEKYGIPTRECKQKTML